MFGVGMWEVVLILVVALLVFGPSKLPELARQLGKGLAEFRRASTELRQSVMAEVEEPSRPAPPRGPADEMAAAAPPAAPPAPPHGPAGAEPVETPALPKPG
jgi:TatA/E family protein of Tat protein translocase